MTDQKQKNNTGLSFQAISKQFRSEAVSLLPETVIDETEASEKRLFDTAEQIGLSPNQLVYGNTLRYCKELVRRKQPFFALYQLLCLLTEISITMLIISALFSLILCLTKQSWHFTDSFDGLYLLIASTALHGYRYTKNELRRKTLQTESKTGKYTKTDAWQPQKLQKKLQRQSGWLAVLFLLLAGTAASVTLRLSLAKYVKINVLSLLMGYISLLFIQGVHNTVYSSHLIPFFTIGIFILKRKDTAAIDTAAQKYIRLSYVQFLGQAHGTDNPPCTDHDLQKKLRTRINTQRTYLFFALVLCVPAAFLCLFQLLHGAFYAGLLVFLALLILIIFLLLTALLSDVFLLKKLPQILE
ncbi:MAG: hypothetical protein LUH14_02025 [Clostridiaceae bacterium]|nr:hypothetical protein [Clostridiaceae bacterium]